MNPHEEYKHVFAITPNELGNGFFLENVQYMLSSPVSKFAPTKNEKVIYTEDNIPVRKVYFSVQSIKVSVSTIYHLLPRIYRAHTSICDAKVSTHECIFPLTFVSDTGNCVETILS